MVRGGYVPRFWGLWNEPQSSGTRPLGEPQIRGDNDRSEKSVGMAVLAYVFVLRVCHHEIVPGKSWGLFQPQQALRLRVMTNQIEPQGKSRWQRLVSLLKLCVTATRRQF